MYQKTPENPTSPLSSQKKCGFTLVEVIIALFILATVALALARSMIYLQYTAEANTYEATAATFANNILSQMKDERSFRLKWYENISLINVVGIPDPNSANASVNERWLDLDSETGFTTALLNRNNSRTMDLTITPSINKQAEDYLLSVRYDYNHPYTGRVISKTVRSIRSSVDTF